MNADWICVVYDDNRMMDVDSCEEKERKEEEKEREEKEGLRSRDTDDTA